MLQAQEYISSLLTGRVKQNFDKAIEDAGNFAEAGSISPSQFKDIKQAVNRALDNSWEEVVSKPFWWNGNGQFRTEDERKVYYLISLRPECHTVVGYQRKVQAADYGHGPMRQTILKILSAGVTVAAMVNPLKDIVSKRQPKPVEDQKAKYLAPTPSVKSVAMTKTILEEQVAEAKSMIKAQIEMSLIRAMEVFLVAQDEAHRNGNFRYTNFDCFWAHGSRIRSHQNYDFTNKALDMTNLNSKEKLTPKANWKHITSEYAEAKTNELCEQFIIKNLKKLSPILTAKDNLKSVQPVGKISPASMSGILIFTFEDGAKFRITLRMEWGTSKLGLEFQRFPLRFHDVLMAGGVRMSQPSEERMNTVFVA